MESWFRETTIPPKIQIGYEFALNAAMAHVLRKEDCGFYHIGCAMFVNNELAVVTSNSKEFHAEMAAFYLTEIPNGSIIELVIVRITKDPKKPVGISKPCSDCLEFLRSMNVRSVYYTLDSGVLVNEKPHTMTTSHVRGKHKIAYPLLK